MKGTGQRHLRFFGSRSPSPVLPLLAAALVASLQPAAAQAETGAPATELREGIANRAAGDLRAFYQARGNAPVWVEPGGRISDGAYLLVERLRTARLDGVNPRKLKADRIARLLERAERGTEADRVRLELALSNAFVNYVRRMRGVAGTGMIYESAALAPVVPTPRAALAAAVASGSLKSYIERIGWMNPLYAPLRNALADPALDSGRRAQLATNLARLRAIPYHSGRHILVDAAGARLWMYEGAKPVDSMRVVVGKPELQTPMMAGFVRHAVLNPYWNIPDDLVQHTIAANVLDKGLGYLKAGGYQVLADWRSDAPLLDPAKVDWREVFEGRRKVHVRQLPGGDNFMGKVKFEFPNAQGIYLHDTPSRNLLKLDQRQLSSGCVRLEDAGRLGRWLFGKPIKAQGRKPEQVVPLPEVVPIYITYLTAVPEGARIAFRDDPYGRDGMRMASGGDESGKKSR